MAKKRTGYKHGKWVQEPVPHADISKYVDRDDVIAKAKKLEKKKKFKTLTSPHSGSKIPMRIKVPKRK